MSRNFKGFLPQMGKILLTILLFFKHPRNFFAVIVGAMVGFQASAYNWAVILFCSIFIAEVGYNFYMYRKGKTPFGQKFEKTKLSIHKKWFNLIAYNLTYLVSAVIGLIIPTIFENAASHIQHIHNFLSVTNLILLLIGVLIFTMRKYPAAFWIILIMITVSLLYTVVPWLIRGIVVFILIILVVISVKKWVEHYTRWKVRIMLDEMSKFHNSKYRNPDEFDHFGQS